MAACCCGDWNGLGRLNGLGRWLVCNWVLAACVHSWVLGAGVFSWMCVVGSWVLGVGVHSWVGSCVLGAGVHNWMCVVGSFGADSGTCRAKVIYFASSFARFSYSECGLRSLTHMRVMSSLASATPSVAYVRFARSLTWA